MSAGLIKLLLKNGAKSAQFADDDLVKLFRYMDDAKNEEALLSALRENNLNDWIKNAVGENPSRSTLEAMRSPGFQAYVETIQKNLPVMEELETLTEARAPININEILTKHGVAKESDFAVKLRADVMGYNARLNARPSGAFNQAAAPTPQEEVARLQAETNLEQARANRAMAEGGGVATAPRTATRTATRTTDAADDAVKAGDEADVAGDTVKTTDQAADTAKPAGTSVDASKNAAKAGDEAVENSLKTNTEEKTDVIPKPHTTPLHQVVRFDPFQWTNERIRGRSFESGASRAWRSIPHKLFSHKIIRPAIEYVDDAVKEAGIIEPIKELDKKLLELRRQRASTNAAGEIARIDKETEELLTKFSENHGKKFKELEKSLDPFLNELRAYPEIEFMKGQIGLDKSQRDALIKMAEHYKKMCQATYSPDDLINQYNQNRVLFDEAKKTAEGISGAFQHYTNLAASTDLRLATREHTGWRGPRLRLNVFPIDIHGTGLHNVTHSYDRLYKNGDDGVFSARYTPTLQNVQLLERELKDGYFSTKIRTATVTDNVIGPDNAENYGIVLTKIYQDNVDPKTGKLNIRKEEFAGQAAKLFQQAYDAGRIGDFLNSYRRLIWQQGPGGMGRTYPELMVDMLEKTRPNDEHFQEVVESIKALEGIDHSPALFAPRHMNQVAEQLTDPIHQGRIAAGKDVLGTPGKITFIQRPMSYLTRQLNARLVGGTVVQNVDENGKVVTTKPFKIETHFWAKKNPGEGQDPVRWRDTVWTRSAFSPIGLPRQLVMTPIQAAGFGLRHVGGPVFSHTWRLGTATALGAGALWAAGEGLEAATGNEIFGSIGSVPIKALATPFALAHNVTISEGLDFLPFMSEDAADIHLWRNGSGPDATETGDNPVLLAGMEGETPKAGSLTEDQLAAAHGTPVQDSPTGTITPVPAGARASASAQGGSGNAAAETVVVTESQGGPEPDGGPRRLSEQAEDNAEQEGGMFRDMSARFAEAGKDGYGDDAAALAQKAGGAVKNVATDYLEWASVNPNKDGVDETVDQLANVAGGVIGDTVDFTGRTVSTMAEPGNETGQNTLGWIGGIAGGAVGTLAASKMLNILDEKFLRKIPLVGGIMGTLVNNGLVKILIFGALMLAARKGTHAMLPDAQAQNPGHTTTVPQVRREFNQQASLSDPAEQAQRLSVNTAGFEREIEFPVEDDKVFRVTPQSIVVVQSANPAGSSFVDPKILMGSGDLVAGRIDANGATTASGNFLPHDLAGAVDNRRSLMESLPVEHIHAPENKLAANNAMMFRLEQDAARRAVVPGLDRDIA